MLMNETLQEKRRRAPRATGVYLMKDKDGIILYVGKSKDLKSRVHAYFSGTDGRLMIPHLVSRVCDIDFILAATEKEALILENNLIKRHRPRYNVNFRDDKAYFNIRIDGITPFPLFELVRKVKEDSAFYFGPYPSSAAARETLQFLQSVFPLRTCKGKDLKSRRRPCVEYQIKRCCAPCVGLIDREAYGKMVAASTAFLDGKGRKLIRQLEEDMKAASHDMRFEEAALLRDRIGAIRKTLEKQAVASLIAKDQDVWGVAAEEDRVQFCILHIRGGKLIGKRSFAVQNSPLGQEEIFSSLITQYYQDKVTVPPWVLLPFPLADHHILEEWFHEKRGGRVRLYQPLRGSQADLVKMASRNALQAMQNDLAAKSDFEEVMKILQESMRLKKLPQRMECFDVSHIGGNYAVASMVTFQDGKPWKDGYRRYKISAVEGIDDYAMMGDVLRRRYRRDGERPDLLIVDGGKGQLGIALEILKELKIEEQDVVAIAKERSLFSPKGEAKEEDRFYLPGRKTPLYLTKKPRALRVLQHIRDEAHRFASEFFRKTKEKGDFHSLLDDIPGVGKTRKTALLKAFGDVASIRAATAEAIAQVPGIGVRQGQVIFAFLNREKEEE